MAAVQRLRRKLRRDLTSALKVAAKHGRGEYLTLRATLNATPPLARLKRAFLLAIGRF